MITFEVLYRIMQLIISAAGYLNNIINSGSNYYKLQI